MIGLILVFTWIAGEIGSYLNEKVFSFVNHENVFYILVDNFIFTAVLEEAAKFLALWLVTRKSKIFTHTVHGLIYTLTVAFGFIAFENFIYMLEDASPIMILYRGVIGAMAHLADGVFMGYYYGNAKYADAIGDKVGKRKNLIKALVIPVLWHGAYDSIIDFVQVFDSDLALLLVFVLFIAEIVLAVKVVKKAFKENREIPGVVEENTELTFVDDEMLLHDEEGNQIHHFQ